MKKAAFLTAFLAAMPVAAAPAWAGDVLKYSTSVAGIPLGKIKIMLDGGEADYSVRANFSMIPILRMIFHGDASAQAAGINDGGKLRPRESVFRYAGRKSDRSIAIAFDEAGIPVAVNANPPLRQRSYAIGVEGAAGAVDPASAASILMTPRSEPCALSFDVFDGSKRHRVSLTGQRGAAKGSTVTCTGLYERVSGFKDKYMTPERRTWPFTATVKGTDGRWVPLKITAETKFGPASATLR
jgi:hypothetical protein